MEVQGGQLGGWSENPEMTVPKALAVGGETGETDRWDSPLGGTVVGLGD